MKSAGKTYLDDMLKDLATIQSGQRSMKYQKATPSWVFPERPKVKKIILGRLTRLEKDLVKLAIDYRVQANSIGCDIGNSTYGSETVRKLVIEETAYGKMSQICLDMMAVSVNERAGINIEGVGPPILGDIAVNDRWQAYVVAATA